MIYIRIHDTPQGEMVAMCDSELLGNVYSESNVEIDLQKYSDFYKGELVEEKEAEPLAGRKDFYTANIVGERSVSLFIKSGVASKSEVRKIRGIPYLHIYRAI